MEAAGSVYNSSNVTVYFIFYLRGCVLKWEEDIRKIKGKRRKEEEE